MVKLTCVNKICNKANEVTAYILQDPKGQKQIFEPEQVKQAIFLRQIDINNLRLNEDNELEDIVEEVKDSTEQEYKPNIDLECYSMTDDNIASTIADELGIEAKVISFIKHEDNQEMVYSLGNMCACISKLNCDEYESECSRIGRQCKGVLYEMRRPISDGIGLINNIFRGKTSSKRIYNHSILDNIISVYKEYEKESAVEFYDIAYCIHDTLSYVIKSQFKPKNDIVRLVETPINYTDKDNGVVSAAINFKADYIANIRNSGTLEFNLLDVTLSATSECYKIAIVGHANSIGLKRKKKLGFIRFIERNKKKEDTTEDIKVSISDDYYKDNSAFLETIQREFKLAVDKAQTIKNGLR